MGSRTPIGRNLAWLDPAGRYVRYDFPHVEQNMANFRKNGAARLYGQAGPGETGEVAETAAFT